MNLFEATNYFLEEESNEVEYVFVGEGADEDSDSNYDIYDLREQSDVLAKHSNINILRGKDISHVAISDGKVVGGIWEECSPADGPYTKGEQMIYSFDVIVDPKFQNLGIGSKLTDIGISDYDSYIDVADNMVLDVVNKSMEALLKKKGFVIMKEIQNHTFMTLPPKKLKKVKW